MILTLKKPYQYRNGRKLKGDLDERIAEALDALADCPEVVEAVVEDRQLINPQRSHGFEIKGVYQTVAGAVTEVALFGRKGYGRMIRLVSMGITSARDLAEKIYHMKKDSSKYFPEPA